MAFDIVFANGSVVDGTGSKPFRADIGVSGEKIAAVGDLAGADAAVTIACDGLTVSPGFIDIHTHYDPQILWDPDLTPSSWFGVTTVILGNCGFTIAPMRPAGRRACIETLGNTEAMSVEALETGISWEFETFAEYLAAIERRRPMLNVGAFVGHTALRMFALDGDPLREASGDEIRLMKDELDTAMAAGAWGLSTSKSPAHVGFGGRPVPSRLAPFSEVLELASSLKQAGAGVIQGVGGPGLRVAEFGELSRRSGRPVTWCSLHQGVDGDKHWDYYRQTETERAAGADLWAQMACTPNIAGFTLKRPFILNAVPAFGAISERPHAERLATLSDPAWQREAERQIVANDEKRSFQIRWDRILVSESAAHPELVGKTIEQIANGSGSGLKTLVELAKADDLETRFDLILFNYDEPEHAKLLGQEFIVIGLGDGGAHASQLCDSSYPLYLLSRFVRERKDFSLEFAVWRMTGQVASVFGIKDRGEIKPGKFADLCVFDAATIDESPTRRVFDLPAGADRLLKDPIGMEHVLVNGAFIRRSGQSLAKVGSGRLLKPAA